MNYLQHEMTIHKKVNTESISISLTTRRKTKCLYLTDIYFTYIHSVTKHIPFQVHSYHT